MPLAQLSVGSDLITLSGVLGVYSFSSNEVVRVEPVTWFPILASGVRIVHVRDDVAERVIFWHLTPARVLAAIGASGFTPSAPATDVPSRPFPFRIPFLVLCALVWNVPFVMLGLGIGDLPGVGTLVSTGAVCALALGVLLPTPLRTLALRDPASISRVKPLVGLLAFVSGILFAAQCFAFF